MKVNIAWLYPDIKDVFGDKGNIAVLQKRCVERHIDCTITPYHIGDTIDFSVFNLLYFGTNILPEDTYVFSDLKRQKSNLQQAIAHKIPCFFVCGGFLAMGKNFYEGERSIGKGLGILDADVQFEKARCVGNVIATTSLCASELIGFENHHYHIQGITSPLAQLQVGKGNDGNGLQEGYDDGVLLATNLHGPLLPKNPEFADVILLRALHYQDEFATLTPLTLPYEKEARIQAKQRIA